jgi:mannan endo-1,4-beta-mannosidase
LDLSVVFEETAPINAGVLMNPTSFLDTIYKQRYSVCDWV